jgi:WD40 repeat protein
MDVISGMSTATLGGHSSEVTSLAFSPNGLQLASGLGDKSMQSWDPVLGTNIVMLEEHFSITSIVFVLQPATE